MVKLKFCIICTSFILFLTGCLSDDDSSPIGTSIAPQTPSVASGADTAPIPEPPFQAVPIKNRAAFNKLADSLGSDRITMILKLNRRDARHIRRNDTLIIPREFSDDKLSPFPNEIASLRNVPKMILVSLRVQALGAYDHGRLIRWAPTSTGKRATPTPPGLLSVNWKSRLKTSSIDSTWIMPWCVNIHQTRGINIHEYSLPGYPASHRCIRLPEEDAYWLYHWIDTWEHVRGEGVAPGTPVLLFGDYAFGTRAPWKRLAEDSLAQTIATAEIEGELAPHLYTILERVQERNDLLAMDTATISASVK